MKQISTLDADRNLENEKKIESADNLKDIIEKLISSVDKIADEIHELNSHLQSRNLFSGSLKMEKSNNSHQKDEGYFMDYEEFIQNKKSGMKF